MTGPEIAFVLAPACWRPADGDAEALCRAAIRAVAGALPGLDLEGWELGLTITDDPGIRALNRDYRGIDRPTNVLSFPLDMPAPGPVAQDTGARDTARDITGQDRNGPSGGLLGDIVLSGETVQREAGSLGCPAADRLTHLAVHGMLHLLGYDHDTASGAERMEGLEIAILAGLGIPNPYAGPHGAERSPEHLELEHA